MIFAFSNSLAYCGWSFSQGGGGEGERGSKALNSPVLPINIHLVERGIVRVSGMKNATQIIYTYIY